eukprot:g19954.t1
MSALGRRQIVLLSVVLACWLGFTGCWGAPSAADVLPPPVPLHSGLVYLLVWMIDTPENVRRRAFLRTHYATQGLERYGFRLFFGASKFEKRAYPFSNATSSTAAAMEVVRQHLPPAEQQASQQPVLLAPHRHPDEEDFLLLDPYRNGCNRKKHCFPTMQLQWWDFVLHENERLRTTTAVPNETTIIAAVKIEEDSYVDLKTLRTLVDKAEADGHGQWMLGLPLIPYFWDPVGLLEKPTRRRLMPREDCVWDVHRPFGGNIPDHKNADLDLMLKELLFPAPSSAGGVGGLQASNSGSSSAISQRSRTEYQATSTAGDAYYAKRFSAQIRQLFLAFSKAYACYSTPQGGLQGFSTGLVQLLLKNVLPARSFARMVVEVALGELAEEPLFGFLFWLAVAGRKEAKPKKHQILFQPVVAPSTFVHSKMVSVDAAGFDHDRYRTQALEHEVEAGVVETEEEPRIEFCVPFSLGDVENGGDAQVLLQKGTVCDVDGTPGSFDLFLDFDAAVAEAQLASSDDRLLFYDRNHTRSTTSTSTEASSSSLAQLVKQCLPRAAFAPQRIVDAFYKKDMLLYHWGVEQAKILFHGHFSREQELLPGRVFKNGEYETAGNGRPPVSDLTAGDEDRVTTFFGFYYPSPWKGSDNKNDSLVLSHVGRGLELHKMRKEPPFGEEEIPFYRKLELRVYKFRPSSSSSTGVRRNGSEDERSGEQNEEDPRESLLLGRSSAWSFPLGARLMWVGDEETTTVGDEEQEHTVIFNIRVGADDDDASASALELTRTTTDHAQHPRSTSLCGSPAAPAGSSSSPAAAEFASPCYFPNVFRARLVSFTTSSKNNISSQISFASDLPYPVFAISSDGNFYTSLNYVRLYALTNLGVYGLPVGTETALWEILERNGGERISRNDGIWVLPVEKKITIKSSGNYPRPRISARQVVDYMKHHRLKFADGRTAGDWLEPPSVAGEQGQNCFVWLEQPKFSDRGDRISFFARGKCPQFELDNLSNSKLLEKKARASFILSKLQDMRYFDIGAFTLAVEGVGTDGLWYAGSGVPVSHFDFVGDKVKDTVADRRTNLMYCGPSGMHTMADGGSPGVHTMAAENSETQSKSPEKPKKSSNHRSEVIYTTPSNAVPSGYEKWNRKHDLYAGHCTFSRTKMDVGAVQTDVGAVQSIEDPTRFILTDTSCSLCVLPCTKDLPRYLCPLNHEQARDLAILDRETEILYRLGRLQVNVSTPEPLFVDLHPRFAPGNRFVSFDSAHGDAENGLLHARHYVMDVGRLMDHVFGAMSEGGPMGGGDVEILTYAMKI